MNDFTAKQQMRRPTAALKTTKFKFINLDASGARSNRSESNPRKTKEDYKCFASAGNMSDSSRNIDIPSNFAGKMRPISPSESGRSSVSPS